MNLPHKDMLLMHRDNVDPHQNWPDASLNDVLRLINPPNNIREKFSLDAEISDGGVNYSIGEQQLCEWIDNC